MSLNTQKWIHQIGWAYLAPLLGPHQAEQVIAPTEKEIKYKLSLLENLSPDDDFAITLKQDINSLQKPAYQFAKTEFAGKKTKTPLPGKRLPPQEFLELVVIGIELAKRDSKKLQEIRMVLQDSNSVSVPPAEESVFNWTKMLPADQTERFPHTRSVQRVNGESSNTEWANEMKRDYISRLAELYKVGDERMSQQSDRHYSRDLNSKDKILKHLKEKWGKIVSI